MSSNIPFSLSIFVADGDPDGLRLVERSNWSGKAVIFPRSIYPRIKSRDEFGQTGIYLLLGPRKDLEGEALYIGEGDPVRPRLDSHHAQKDFWTRAVFFIAAMGQLNKAHVQYLEAKLVQRAKAANRCELENGNAPYPPSLSEADCANMDVFLQHMLSMFPVLGIDAFEKAEQATPVLPKSGATPIELTCKARSVLGTGYEATQGFVVRSGSQAVSEAGEAPALQKYSLPVYNLRRDLIARGVLVIAGKVLWFTQDYTFSSPSMAAAFVLGCSSNGRTAWKDVHGRTLKEIQEGVALPGSA